jgi:hypothetical protein
MEIKEIGNYTVLVEGEKEEKLVKFLYEKKEDTKEITDITTICKNSFKNVSTIEDFSMKAEGFLTIEESAFENCSKLKTLVLDMKEKKLLIQSDAFKNCNELDCVYIKSANKITIEKDAFSQCYNLRVVILELAPKSTDIEIRESVFESSTDLCIISNSDDVKNYCNEHEIEYKGL